MKKIYSLILILLSFTLFSCASKNVSNENSIDNEYCTAICEEEDITDNSEDIEESGESEEVGETEDEDVLFIDEEVTIEEPDYIHEELEEISEPEVITLEPPEEIIIEEIKQPEPQIEPEPVVEDIDIPDFSDETKEDEENNSDDVVDVVSEVESVDEVSEDGVIDITDDDINNQIDESEQDLQITPEEIVPSRSVTLKKSEYLDITYPGNGWIFMGITDNSKDITYFGRKVGTKDTKFSVQAKNAGTKILHFYKTDAVTNTYIDDYLEVIVLNEKGSNKTHIEAPEYKTPVQVKKPSKKESEKTENTTNQNETTVTKEETTPAVSNTQTTSTPVNNTSSSKSPAVSTQPATTQSTSAQSTSTSAISSPSSESLPSIEEPQETAEIQIAPEQLLAEAKQLNTNKQYKEALDKLNLFFEKATKNVDEALFLKGQILETNSPVQDITKAIETYTTLTKNYPASKYWDDANKRIIYLKRFYLEGR